MILPVAVFLLAICAACPVFGQTAGLPPEWEVRNVLDSLTEQVKKIKPVLEEALPREWARKGAPDAYEAQAKSVRAELDYLLRTSAELSKRPDSLPKALEVLFRMQATESMLGSLEEGIRKYQNPALADLLRGAMSDNAVHAEKLRQYIVQLAAVKEHELAVMNEEAQRCRGHLSLQPPEKTNTQKKGAPR